jgi:hypothetical protein
MFERRCKASNYKDELQHYSDLAGQPKNWGSIPFGVFFKALSSAVIPSLGTAEPQGSTHPLGAAGNNVCSCTHTARAYSRRGAPVKHSHKFTLTLSCPEITSSVS